jgi:hypothetical protein
MWIVASHATIFLREVSREDTVARMGVTPASDVFRIAPSLEPQEIPEWCRETGSWRNGIKDGRLKEVGAGAMVTQPLPAGPQPPAGAKVEAGPPLRVEQS